MVEKKADAEVAGSLRSVGLIRSALTNRHEAPKQGNEGAPDAWLEVHPWAKDGLLGITVGDNLLVITWLHQGRRDTLQVHPRGNPNNPLTGVFFTRSPDRPNPIRSGATQCETGATSGRMLRQI